MIKQYVLSKVIDMGLEFLITSATGGIGLGQYSMLNTILFDAFKMIN